tara:strand:- start:26 stop:199 length:174 start_codon:yes stop_codon:yes gene_type:complete
MAKKKLTKAQQKKLLNTARTAFGKLLIEKIATGQGPMSLLALVDIGKKIDMAMRKLK